MIIIYKTRYNDMIRLFVTLSYVYLWRHHPCVYDVIARLSMTSSPVCLWRHHPSVAAELNCHNEMKDTWNRRRVPSVIVHRSLMDLMVHWTPQRSVRHSLWNIHERFLALTDFLFIAILTPHRGHKMAGYTPLLYMCSVALTECHCEH